MAFDDRLLQSQPTRRSVLRSRVRPDGEDGCGPSTGRYSQPGARHLPKETRDVREPSGHLVRRDTVRANRQLLESERRTRLSPKLALRQSRSGWSVVPPCRREPQRHVILGELALVRRVVQRESDARRRPEQGLSNTRCTVPMPVVPRIAGHHVPGVEHVGKSQTAVLGQCDQR